MIRNYFKTALRALLRQRGYALINIAGLAGGIACCLLILIFIQDEQRYDRHHDRADRIYRVTADYTEGSHWAPIGPPVGFALRDAVPEIEQVARVFPMGTSVVLRREDQLFEERNGVYADSTIFDVFTLPLVRGNPETALVRPSSAVLSESMARKYFGDTDPMGQTLNVNDWFDITVTGIMKDVPPTTHLPMDFMVSMSTFYGFNNPDNQLTWAAFYTYALLGESFTTADVQQKMPSFLHAFFGDRFDETPEDVVRMVFQPLPDIHLHSSLEKEYRPNSDIIYIYVFALIALFVLLIACINFVNLTTARAGNRMREVGVRKSLGSARSQLAVQFMGESLLMSSIALVFAHILLTLCIPLLNQITGKDLPVEIVYSPEVLLSLLGMTVLAGMLSGVYPALVMSGFNPIRALKGASVPGTHRSVLRKGLVVFQFGISICLIVGTAIVYAQLDFFRARQLGFEKEGIINVRLSGESSNYVSENLETVKQELLRHPGILNISLAADVPGERYSLESFRVAGQPDDEATMMRVAWGVDHDYIPTLGIELTDGRNFSQRAPADTNAWILNESAVHRLGLEDPVGQILAWGDDYIGPIVGIARNFNFASLHQEVEPLVIPLRPGVGNMLLVRTQTGELPEVLNFLEEEISQLAPNTLFKYTFVDDQIDMLYRAEDQLSKVFGYFSLISILIACLGLFGLAAYSAEQRSKEIGIRKVLGASVPNIFILLSRDFARLVMVAFLVAAPISFLVMNRWLQAFAYRIDLSIGYFILGGILALAIALLTVSYQAVRAAIVNPVEALRYE